MKTTNGFLGEYSTLFSYPAFQFLFNESIPIAHAYKTLSKEPNIIISQGFLTI